MLLSLDQLCRKPHHDLSPLPVYIRSYYAWISSPHPFFESSLACHGCRSTTLISIGPLERSCFPLHIIISSFSIKMPMNHLPCCAWTLTLRYAKLPQKLSNFSVKRGDSLFCPTGLMIVLMCSFQDPKFHLGEYSL